MSAEWFAGRLRELREQAGLTQPQLAEKVGVTTRQISRLETGVSIAAWDTVVALAAALGVGVEAFTVPPKDEPAPQRGRPRKGSAPEVTPAKFKPAAPESRKPAAKKGRRKKGGKP